MKRADQNYIDGFFGDSGVSSEMTNTQLKRAIAELRREYIFNGDYIRGIDPTAQEIFRATRELYPRK